MQPRKRVNVKEPKMDQSTARLRRNLPAYTMNLGGSGVRVNPLGVALLVFVGLLFLFYTFGGSVGGGSVNKYERYVSMKKLLAVSIEMAKRGGAEVKRIRQQARSFQAD